MFLPKFSLLGNEIDPLQALNEGIDVKIKKEFYLILGSYYCYDNPAGLEDVMKSDLKISSSTFTALYSWYSWPNVV